MSALPCATSDQLAEHLCEVGGLERESSYRDHFRQVAIKNVIEGGGMASYQDCEPEASGFIDEIVIGSEPFTDTHDREEACKALRAGFEKFAAAQIDAEIDRLIRWREAAELEP